MKLTIKTASEELLKFRERHGITQEKLEEKTGVTRQAITRIEAGKVKPHATTIYKLNEYIKQFS